MKYPRSMPAQFHTVWLIGLMMLAEYAIADHKAGHNPGGGDGTAPPPGQCWSGGKPNTANKPVCPITITKVADLRFPSVISGFSQVVVVNPSDSAAAVFEITGFECSRIRADVIENIEFMTAGGGLSGDSIEIRDFTYGGSLDSLGQAVTDCTTGNLQNIRVGGTASISSTNNESFYEGTPTLRVLYY